MQVARHEAMQVARHEAIQVAKPETKQARSNTGHTGTKRFVRRFGRGLQQESAIHSVHAGSDPLHPQ